MLLGFCFFEVVFLVSAHWLARVWFSCEHSEQRVLVAAPRFALYVARNKHPLLAFWYEWMGACLPMARYLDFFHVCPRGPFSLSSLLLCPVFCAALVASFSATHIVRQTDQKIYLLLLTFG